MPEQPKDPYAEETRGMTPAEEERFRQYRGDVTHSGRRENPDAREDRQERIAGYEAEQRARETMKTEVDDDDRRHSGIFGKVSENIERVADVADGVESIEFDPDGIQRVINRVLDLIELKLVPGQAQAIRLTRIRQRGDYASDSYAKTANAAGEIYLKNYQDTQEALERYVAKLESIKDNYVRHDDETAAALDRMETS